jgi:hypothetical protein
VGGYRTWTDRLRGLPAALNRGARSGAAREFFRSPIDLGSNLTVKAASGSLQPACFRFTFHAPVATRSTWSPWPSNCPATSNVTVRWQSVAGVNYFLECSTDLGAPAPFTPLATGIPGLPGMTSYTDTNAPVVSPLFYRVGVGH